MKQLIMTAALVLCTTAASWAQMIDYHWDTHGVGFSIPRDFSVTNNDSEEFSAENTKIFLTIAPVQDGDITKDNLADVVVAMASGLEYDEVSEADEAEVDDFTGYYVLGKKDGVNAVVMALLDTESSTNLLVVIVYADGMENKAVEIANSFYAYD